MDLLVVDNSNGLAHGRHLASQSRSFWRRARWLAFLGVMLISGCASTAPSPDPYRLEPPPETFSAPLPFGAHDFWGYCFNVTDCHIDYNNFDYGLFESHGDPTYVFPPPMSDLHQRYLTFSTIGIRNFPKPAKVAWKSLDGVAHETTVDLAAIFREQLTWHRVPADDMKKFYSGPGMPRPDIFIEIDDRTVNVIITMFIPTVRAQPENPRSFHRWDFIRVWSRTF